MIKNAFTTPSIARTVDDTTQPLQTRREAVAAALGAVALAGIAAAGIAYPDQGHGAEPARPDAALLAICAEYRIRPGSSAWVPDRLTP
jgi:hypothetical protein